MSESPDYRSTFGGRASAIEPSRWQTNRCDASACERRAQQLAGRKVETRLHDAAACTIDDARLIHAVVTLESDDVIAELIEAALHGIGLDHLRRRRAGTTVAVVMGRRQCCGADGDSQACRECDHLHLTLPYGSIALRRRWDS